MWRPSPGRPTDFVPGRAATGRRTTQRPTRHPRGALPPARLARPQADCRGHHRVSPQVHATNGAPPPTADRRRGGRPAAAESRRAGIIEGHQAPPGVAQQSAAKLGRSISSGGCLYGRPDGAARPPRPGCGRAEAVVDVDPVTGREHALHHECLQGLVHVLSERGPSQPGNRRRTRHLPASRRTVARRHTPYRISGLGRGAARRTKPEALPTTPLRRSVDGLPRWEGMCLTSLGTCPRDDWRPSATR